LSFISCSARAREIPERVEYKNLRISATWTPSGRHTAPTVRRVMYTTQTSYSLSRLFSELVDGTSARGDAFILNTGDVGLLRSLDKLSASDASTSVNDGATIAAHALHGRQRPSTLER